MALATQSTQEITPVSPKHNESLPGTEVLAVLMAGTFAGVAMTKTARKQYRRLVRKAMWKAMGMKLKAAFSFKKKQDETVMGLNFFVFLLLVVLGVAIGAAIFGLTGFLILLGLAVIIYLLLRDG